MSNFQQRLYDHEVDPPANAWDKIGAALEKERIYDFQEVLYKSASTPPPAVWDRIRAELDTESIQAPVRPLIAKPRTIPVFLRYAVAALLVGAVAASAFFFFNRNNDTRVLSDQAQPVVPADSSQPGTGQPATNSLAVAGPQGDTGMSPGDQSQDEPVRSRTVAFATRKNRNTPVQPASTEYSNPLYAYEDPVPSIAERYVMLMTPDGGFIRMSKKLGALVCCVTGQEQDDPCGNQIRKLQAELATSPTGAGNVLDVLDIVNSLDNGTRL